jgi:hypothetical protein
VGPWRLVAAVALVALASGSTLVDAAVTRATATPATTPATTIELDQDVS